MGKTGRQMRKQEIVIALVISGRNCTAINEERFVIVEECRSSGRGTNKCGHAHFIRAHFYPFDHGLVNMMYHMNFFSIVS